MLSDYSREQCIQISINSADRYGFPRVVMVGCGEQESHHRQYARRPLNPAQDAAYWPDVSMSVYQQTIAFSEEYAAEGGDWRVYPGPETVERIGNRYYDVPYAADVAARKLAGIWAELPNRGREQTAAEALAVYNAGWSLPLALNPNRRNIIDSVAAAAAILADWEEPVTEETKQAVITQLGAIWGLAGQETDDAREWAFKQAVIAIKSALGLNG